MKTTIIVKNLEFQAYHGCLPAERELPRRFQVDAFISIDAKAASLNDDLSQTVDYYILCQLLEEWMTKKTYKLLESVAWMMVEEIVKRWPGAEVELELRKLFPSCPGNPQYTAVRLNHR